MGHVLSNRNPTTNLVLLLLLLDDPPTAPVAILISWSHLKLLFLLSLSAVFGGEGEIRTHEPRKEPPVFKTGAFNRSATSPAYLRRGSGLYRNFPQSSHVGPQ